MKKPTFYLDWVKPAPYARASPGFFKTTEAPRKPDGELPLPFEWGVIDESTVRAWDAVDIPLVSGQLPFPSMVNCP